MNYILQNAWLRMAAPDLVDETELSVRARSRQNACYERCFLVQVICNINANAQTRYVTYEQWQDLIKKVRVNNINKWSG